MIGSASMASVSPGMSSAPVEAASSAPTPSAAQTSSNANDAGVQEANTETTAPSQAASRKTSQDDQPSEFDRLLEAPAATGDAAEKPAPPALASTSSGVERAATQKADRPDPSLAEQLLGLLGLLTPTATTQSTPNAGTPQPTTVATPAMPQLPATTGNAAAALPAQPALQTSPLLAGGTLAVATTTADAMPLPAAVDPKQAAAFSAQMAGVAATLVADQAPVRADGTAALIADATPLTPVVNLATTTPAVTTPAPLVSAPLPLLQPANAGAGYGDELGTGVVWLAEQRIGHAQLQVTPDHLGPIEVRLQIDGARVHAEFYSAQADVRHALEASLPRLRDLLGQHGLQLSQADVGQRQHNGPHAPPTPDPGDTECFPDGSRPLPAIAHRIRGLLDEYA
jgi:flagellar hook-length control protein FliK